MVDTDADRELDKAARDIRRAVQRLHDAQSSCGYDQYNREYREKLRRAKFDLEGVLIELDRAEG